MLTASCQSLTPEMNPRSTSGSTRTPRVMEPASTPGPVRRPSGVTGVTDTVVVAVGVAVLGATVDVVVSARDPTSHPATTAAATIPATRAAAGRCRRFTGSPGRSPRACRLEDSGGRASLQLCTVIVAGRTSIEGCCGWWCRVGGGGWRMAGGCLGTSPPAQSTNRDSQNANSSASRSISNPLCHPSSSSPVAGSTSFS